MNYQNSTLTQSALPNKKTAINTSYQCTNSSMEQLDLSMSQTSQTWPKSCSLDTRTQKRNILDPPCKQEFKHEHVQPVPEFELCPFGEAQEEEKEEEGPTVSAFGGFGALLGAGIEDCIANV